MCATLFGSAPSATYDEVVDHLEEAERLSDKPDIENKYYLGMTYIKMESYEKGVELLQEVCDLPATKDSQEAIKNESRDVVSRYSSYS